MKIDLIKKESIKVVITTTKPWLGTVTADPEVYKRFIAEKATPEQVEEELSSLPPQERLGEMEVKGWTRFASDDRGLFIWDYMVKGFLKHAGEVLVSQHKIKAIRGKIDDLVNISPRKIYLEREGQLITKPDSVYERPLRGMTPQGPRVCLARSDLLEPPVNAEFTIEVLSGKKEEITLPLVLGLLDYGQFCGLGQFRNGGFGQFTWYALVK